MIRTTAFLLALSFAPAAEAALPAPALYAPPSLQVFESDAPQTVPVFVYVSPPSPSPVRVTYRVSDGSVPESSFTLPAWSCFQVVTIPVAGDADPGPDRVLWVTWSSPQVSVPAPTVIKVIDDDNQPDPAAPRSVTAAAAAVTENDDPEHATPFDVVLTASRPAEAGRTVYVWFHYEDGTATAWRDEPGQTRGDYRAYQRVAAIPPGQAQARVTCFAVGVPGKQGPRSFRFVIDRAVWATPGGPAVVTITD